MRGMNKKYSHDNEFHINHNNNNNNNMATTETISVFSGKPIFLFSFFSFIK